MALPTTIESFAGRPGHHPPFKTSGGSFYAVGVESTGDIAIYKADSDDPTSGWTEQDAAEARGGPAAGACMASVFDGTIIHSAFWNGFSYSYKPFDTSTDTYNAFQAIDAVENDPTQPWISLAIRSDGDVVAVYAGDTDQNMGGKKERVDFNVRTGGTWGGPVALGVDADVHDGNPNCVLGTNDFVHCVWQHTVDTTDPPTAWTDTHGRSIDPADDSASTLDISDADTESVLLGYPNVISYDDGGTQRIIASGFDSAGTTLDTAQATEDGSDEILLTATGVTESFSTEPGFANGEAGISTFVELSGDIHCLYSGDGAAGADQDLWYTTSADDGASWSAPTEEIDAITVNFISANIYVRGSDTVMAYVYDDGGVQKYNEKVLIAGGAAALVEPPLLHSFAVTRAANY